LISYWLLWQVTPPVMATLAQFLESTMRTQADLAKTQSDIAESQRKLVGRVEEVSRAAVEIVEAEKATQQFMEQVTRNFAVIRQRIETHGAGVTVIDLSGLLDPSCFIHKQDVFEHLNTTGRTLVAQRVAQAALTLLHGKQP
jgi:hypothetical protein